jgi:hypothetical protein
MKRFVLFFVIVTCCFIYSDAATITWTGAVNNNWNNAGNWLPNTSVPGSNDDVVFNTSAIVNMDVLTSTTYTINSLKVTNNANVELSYTRSGGANRNLRVKSTDATTMGLKIDAGCVLLIHGINTSSSGTLNYVLDMAGAAGVTGEISGELDFSGAGSGGTSDSTRLRVYTNGANNGNLVVKNPGVIKYLALSGNTTSAPGAYLTMENGSTYEIAKNNGFFPQATWQPNSLARATSPGTTVPGFVDGVVYGNLEWNCPAQLNSDLNVDVTFNNVTFLSTNGQAFRVTGSVLGNNTMTINGNLEIQSGCYLDLLGADAPSGSSGKIILKGDLTNQFGGVLITNGTAGTTSQLELNGSTNQNITMNGIFSGVRLEFIMNGDSATLLTPVILPGDNNAAGANLQLVNGKIITTSANWIRLNKNATYSGGSSNSFVSGPMRKLGDNDFVFPIGIGSIYAPIGIINVINQLPTDLFIAEYKRANPQSTVPYSSAHDVSLDHVSYVEYWTLRQATGTSFKQVSLAVNITSFCTNLAHTYVSHWTSLWTNEASVITNGPFTTGLNQTGTIKSTTIFQVPSTSTNAFTLATELPFSDNPLPLKLISFDASKLSSTKASVNWELGAISSPSVKFEVQKADANKNFSSIAVVNGSTTDRFYSYLDNDLKNGINYYRLRMIDENGKISYSRVVAVMNGTNGLLLTSLIPTVVNNSAMLTIASSGRQQLDLMIVDMQGRIVQKQNHSINAGNTTIQLSVDRLSAGVYQLIGISSEGKTNMIRFVKQ